MINNILDSVCGQGHCLARMFTLASDIHRFSRAPLQV